MACKERRWSYKKDINLVTTLATKFCKISKQPVQVYYKEIYTRSGVEIMYDFEPINNDRCNIVKVINYVDCFK